MVYYENNIHSILFVGGGGGGGVETILSYSHYLSVPGFWVTSDMAPISFSDNNLFPHRHSQQANQQLFQLSHIQMKLKWSEAFQVPIITRTNSDQSSLTLKVLTLIQTPQYAKVWCLKFKY